VARPAEDSSLRDLYWRDEILQVMYWLSGEGLAENVSAEQLANFLGENAAMLQVQLERLAIGGHVTLVSTGHYRLSESGAEHGQRTFADEFAGMTGQAHGECGPSCWCHTSREEAAACLQERLSHGAT